MTNAGVTLSTYTIHQLRDRTDHNGDRKMFLYHHPVQSHEVRQDCLPVRVLISIVRNILLSYSKNEMTEERSGHYNMWTWYQDMKNRENVIFRLSKSWHWYKNTNIVSKVRPLRKLALSFVGEFLILLKFPVVSWNNETNCWKSGKHKI